MKALVPSLLLLTASAVAIAWRLHGQLEAERDRVRAAAEVRQALEQRLTDQEMQASLDLEWLRPRNAWTSPHPGPAQNSRSDKASPSQASAAALSTTSSAANARTVLRKEDRARMRELANSQVARDVQRVRIQGYMQSWYADLIAEFGLGPEEAKRFLALLVDEQTRNGEAMWQDGRPLDDAMHDAQVQTEAELQALLGAERFSRYESYRRNIGERQQLNDLRQAFNASEVPLTDQQSANLLTALVEERDRVPPPAMPLVPSVELLAEFFRWSGDYESRIRERAAAFLTPEQITRLREYQDWQSSQRQMQWDAFHRGRTAGAGDRERR